jgi:hypothetical protein
VGSLDADAAAAAGSALCGDETTASGAWSSSASERADDDSVFSYLIIGFSSFRVPVKTEGMAEGLAAIPKDADNTASVSCLVRLTVGMHSFCQTWT